MKVPDGVGRLDGGLILPSGIARHELERRDLLKKYPHLAHRYLDPQLYLAGLNVATCKKACVNLSSYGWFGGDSPLETFDSNKHSRQSWKANAKQAIGQSWLGRVPSKDAEIADTL